MQQVQKNKSFGYSIDQSVVEVIAQKKFTLSAEMIPPRNGENQEKTMAKLQRVVSSGVDFLSVTKGAGGSLRGGSLPITQAIKDHFTRPCIAHFTCRDLIPQEIENQLVDHHYFGIRNILALRGDPPMGEEVWQPREGGYSYAYELIQQIKKMNQGSFIERPGFKATNRQKTEFCIGCAIYPEHPNEEERFRFARMKFEAGAEYGISQMIFDPEVYGAFKTGIEKFNIAAPIIPGIRILRSKKQGRIMQSRFGCEVPDWYMDQLPEEHVRGEDDPAVLRPFVELVERLQAKGAPGVHIFVLNDVELCHQAMKILGEAFQ